MPKFKVGDKVLWIEYNTIPATFIKYWYFPDGPRCDVEAVIGKQKIIFTPRTEHLKLATKIDILLYF